MRFICQDDGTEQHRRVVLAPKEQVILRLIRDRRLLKEVAYVLDRTENSIKTSVFRLCRGLELHGVRALYLWALQHPGATLGEAVDVRLHPPDCLCDLAFCRSQQREKKTDLAA